jgi:hypothetical protein
MLFFPAPAAFSIFTKRLFPVSAHDSWLPPLVTIYQTETLYMVRLN